MNAPRTIAFGDMHGCDSALARLLVEIQPQPKDTIIGLGDYVDRGPDTKATIDRLLRLQDTCETVFLLGNHELMMRSALIDESDRGFWLSAGGAATAESYGNELENIPESHLTFLNACVPYFETEQFFFVHANYTPNLELDRQPDFALFWEHLTAHLPSRHISGKTAVVGHTPQRSGDVLDLDYLICLDTFCYGGGWLTAMDLTSRKIWQADMHGKLRTQESVAE